MRLDSEAAKLLLHFQLESLLEIGKRLIPELDTFATSQTTDPDPSKSISKGVLIPELKDYLKDKGFYFAYLFPRRWIFNMWHQQGDSSQFQKTSLSE